MVCIVLYFYDVLMDVAKGTSVALWWSWGCPNTYKATTKNMGE